LLDIGPHRDNDGAGRSALNIYGTNDKYLRKAITNQGRRHGRDRATLFGVERWKTSGCLTARGADFLYDLGTLTINNAGTFLNRGDEHHMVRDTTFNNSGTWRY